MFFVVRRGCSRKKRPARGSGNQRRQRERKRSRSKDGRSRTGPRNRTWKSWKLVGLRWWPCYSVWNISWSYAASLPLVSAIKSSLYIYHSPSLVCLCRPPPHLIASLPVSLFSHSVSLHRCLSPLPHISLSPPFSFSISLSLLHYLLFPTSLPPCTCLSPNSPSPLPRPLCLLVSRKAAFLRINTTTWAKCKQFSEWPDTSMKKLFLFVVEDSAC